VDKIDVTVFGKEKKADLHNAGRFRQCVQRERKRGGVLPTVVPRSGFKKKHERAHGGTVKKKEASSNSVQGGKKKEMGLGA